MYLYIYTYRRFYIYRLYTFEHFPDKYKIKHSDPFSLSYLKPHS